MCLFLLQELLHVRNFELGIHLVSEKEIVRLNETFLHHQGSTDVISFNYAFPGSLLLWGEIFVCVDEAVVQAARFHTTWESELARYVIHGVLHLSGYDDVSASARRKMKREENRLLRLLPQKFSATKRGLRKAASAPTLAA